MYFEHLLSKNHLSFFEPLSNSSIAMNHMLPSYFIFFFFKEVFFTITLSDHHCLFSLLGFTLVERTIILKVHWFLALEAHHVLFPPFFFLSPFDEPSFLWKSLTEENLLPLNFLHFINSLNFLMMRTNSSSSSLSFSSSTSYFSFVEALKAMFFFFLSSPSCFSIKVISYVIKDPMSSSKCNLSSL